MAEKEKTLLKEEEKSSVGKKVHAVFEVVGLTVASIVLLATFVVNGLAGSNDYAKFGFKNQTGDVSDEFYTEITPAGWAFSIWGIIYTWQAIWILYGWSFVLRPSYKKVINPVVYILYTFANICNIIWIYLWGNLYVQVAFPFIALISFFLICAIGVEVVYLYKLSPPSDSTKVKAFKIECYLAQIIVVNGITIYATWVTIATLINFTVVLQYFGNYDSTNSATIALAFLAFEVIVYFVLENTLLDRFLRFVFMPYLVVIWALSAAVSAHYGVHGDLQNDIFSIILLVITIILFIVRIVLWIIFTKFRRLASQYSTVAV